MVIAAAGAGASLTAIYFAGGFSQSRRVNEAEPRAATSVAATAPAASPRNAGVAYVAEAECDECHAEIAARFRQHPMGRSLATVAAAEPIEDYSPQAHNPFEHSGFRYAVEQSAGSAVLHREWRLDAAGQPILEAVEPVHYAVGSGRRGRSYLLDRDGSLWMSPITWYPQKGFWDLSPGYETNNSHFARPVQTNCLFCHCDQARPIANSLNRYERPIFAHGSIGCQRCHGPGELHVEHQRGVTDGANPVTAAQSPRTGAADDTIVNSARLSLRLRDAICEQCHLAGEIRVPRRGRGEFDYRPGLPLDETLAVFVRPHDGGRQRFVGHVEQMRASRCFTASRAADRNNPEKNDRGGALACVSCHDPHSLPAEPDRIAFYNDRCGRCHSSEACTAPGEVRSATIPPDNCIACHMSPTRSEVRHAATTDHRIPRSPGRSAEPPAPSAVPSVLPVVNFHRPRLDLASDQDRRDLAVAILMLTSIEPELIEPAHVEIAGEWLAEAVRRHPDDLAALEALGHAHWQQNRSAAAQAAFAEVLRQAPDREFALQSAASLAQSQGREEAAATLLRAAAALNPSHAKYHLDLAAVLGRQRQWAESETAARRALELQPANPGARQLVVESLLGQRKFTDAEREFALLLATKPDGAASLRDWFERHPLRQ